MVGSSPSTRVVQRVAEAEDTEPCSLGTPLYEVVDVDALDQLYESPPGGPNRDAGTVEFEYRDYEVTVTAEGNVSIDE